VSAGASVRGTRADNESAMGAGGSATARGAPRVAPSGGARLRSGLSSAAHARRVVSRALEHSGDGESVEGVYNDDGPCGG
jgi:hypothetical protein